MKLSKLWGDDQSYGVAIKQRNEEILDFYFKIEQWLSELICCKYGNFLIQDIMKRALEWEKGTQVEEARNEFNFESVDLELIHPNLGELKDKKLVLKIIGMELRNRLENLILDNVKHCLSQRYSKFVVCPLIGNDSTSCGFNRGLSKFSKNYSTQRQFTMSLATKLLMMNEDL